MTNDTDPSPKAADGASAESPSPSANAEPYPSVGTASPTLPAKKHVGGNEIGYDSRAGKSEAMLLDMRSIKLEQAQAEPLLILWASEEITGRARH